MKNIQTLLVAFLLLPFLTNAQSLSLDCESGNRAVEQAACWAFGAVSYSNTPAHIISGGWTARSNSMSNSSPSAAWIKSPWFKPGSGNITFKTKLENTTGTTTGQYKALRIRYIAYDAAKPYGEGAFLADSVDYTYLTPFTSTVSLSYPLPASIANSPNPYKVMISFFGTGGNNRAHFDDLVVPGTYWSDPANNCLPIVQNADADGDGIPDADDDYPSDAHRGFNNGYPVNGFGTLLFEDLWPNKGDYDLNDLVLDYRFNIITDSKNEVVEILYSLVIRAVGASRTNGFAFQLDGVTADKIISVQGSDLGNANLNPNGTEAGQSFANIPVINNVKKRFSLTSVADMINVDPKAPLLENDTINIIVTFKDKDQVAPGGPVAFGTFTPADFNPYLIVGGERGKEIHLADRKPTDKMDVKYFGQADDKSSPNQGRYFVTANNLPWALDINSTLPNLVERIDFTRGYLKFVEWAQSGGKQFTDWFLDKPGYRDENQLIKN